MTMIDPIGPAIVLPFPPTILSPNQRPSWQAKARVVKTYRSDCYLITKLAAIRLPVGLERLVVSLHFYPPNRRRRDQDNLIASAKSALDGLADGLGVDDSRFVLIAQVEPFEPRYHRGALRVQLGAALP